jgi:hypothetical protein
MITIKNKLSGEKKQVSDLEYHMMMDSDAWEVIIEKPKAKSKSKKKAPKKSGK